MGMSSLLFEYLQHWTAVEHPTVSSLLSLFLTHAHTRTHTQNECCTQHHPDFNRTGALTKELVLLRVFSHGAGKKGIIYE